MGFTRCQDNIKYSVINHRCEAQLFLVQGSRVLCVCPHFEPYRVFFDDPLDILDKYLKNGCLRDMPSEIQIYKSS